MPLSSLELLWRTPSNSQQQRKHEGVIYESLSHVVSHLTCKHNCQLQSKQRHHVYSTGVCEAAFENTLCGGCRCGLACRSHKTLHAVDWPAKATQGLCCGFAGQSHIILLREHSGLISDVTCFPARLMCACHLPVCLSRLTPW